MNKAERQLNEDKALRDAALAVFQADLKFIREDLAARGVGGRIADRLGDATLDMVDEAADFAEQNKGEVAAAFAAIVPRTVRLSEAPSFGQPITVCDPTSRGARAYQRLAREVGRRLGLVSEPRRSPLDEVLGGYGGDHADGAGPGAATPAGGQEPTWRT